MKAAEIAAALDARKLAVLRHLFPRGKVIGHDFCIGDITGKAGESLKVALNGKGPVWADFNGGQSGGDLLDLWAAARCSGDIGAAMMDAAAWLGIDKPRNNPNQGGFSRSSGAKRPADFVYDYTDAAGNVIARVHRWEATATEKKRFAAQALVDGRWVWQHPPKPRPLYGLADLAARPDATVLICEGEKAADGARDHLPDYVSMAWSGGVQHVRYADYSPLEGRRVVCWPDHDPEGRQAMDEAAAQLIAAGATEVRIVSVPDDSPPKFDLGDPLPKEWTEDTIADLIKWARIVGKPEPEGAAPFEPLPFTAFDPATLAPRRWLLGTSVLCRSATAISAPGGHNKTTLLLQRQIAVATGRPITGEKVWESGRVWYFNLEEDTDEIRRRIAAICIEFGIPQSELADRLLIGAKDTSLITLAQMDDGNSVATADVQRIISTVNRDRIVFLGIDPLIAFHKVSENANEQMQVVVRQCAIIAEQTGAAVEFAAHAKKGATAGDPDANRGASAIRDGVRKLATLAVMTDDEAEEMGIKGAERKRFIRLDDAKANYAAPDDPVSWFRRVGVCLNNGDGVRPADYVGVLRPIDMAAYRADRMADDEESQSLAQALCDAMPADRCAVAGLIGVAQDHGKPCKERAAYGRIAAALPLAPAFRRVTHHGNPWRLYLVKSDPENVRSKCEVCRCTDS